MTLALYPVFQNFAILTLDSYACTKYVYMTSLLQSSFYYLAHLIWRKLSVGQMLVWLSILGLLKGGGGKVWRLRYGKSLP